MTQKRITMADLAELAGVAKITVSRALSDSPSVRPEVRTRIQRLAQKHGYQLNVSARNLRQQRTNSVAVVIEMTPSVDRPMFEPLVLQVVGGILQELTLGGYRLVLTTRGQLQDHPVVDVDGLILLGQGANDQSTRQLRLLGAPMVVWGTPLSGDQTDDVMVGSDNYAGGRMVAEHLIATGRNRLLYLGDASHPEVRARLDGIEAAQAGTNLRVIQTPCAFSGEAARMAVESAIEFGLEFDSVASASDAMALGVIGALRAAGRRVPEDVAVVGYDDTLPTADITSVRQNWVRGGQELGRSILSLIRGRDATSVVLPVELIVRSSSAE